MMMGKQTARHRWITNILQQTCKLTVLGACFSYSVFAGPLKTANVIFVMTDGLRWQEVFRGADAALMTKDAGGVEDVDALRRAYWSENKDERRKKLMPFVWMTLAAQGQIYGDRDEHSDAAVTNGLNFSYPGYSEALCGLADARINSNDKVLNPNETVLEWLNNRPLFSGRIAAFAAWDVFPFIFNAPRAHFPVNAGYEPFRLLSGTPDIRLLNQLKADQPRLWNDEPFDAVPFYTALAYLKARRPKVLFISLGETDDWAHGGRYDLYLGAAHRADGYLKALWETISSMPEYRGRTTLIFGTDHGRGSGTEWTHHGEKLPESKYVFMMFIGPDTPSLGNRANAGTVKQSQIAGTIAALLGEDFKRAVPESGPPLADVSPRSQTRN
jgi:hypothetical protein